MALCYHSVAYMYSWYVWRFLHLIPCLCTFLLFCWDHYISLFQMNVSNNNLFLIKRLYLIRRARLVCTVSLISILLHTRHSSMFGNFTKSKEPVFALFFSVTPRSKHCQNTLSLVYRHWFWRRFCARVLPCPWSLLITKISFLAHQFFIWLHVLLFAECSKRRKKKKLVCMNSHPLRQWH